MKTTSTTQVRRAAARAAAADEALRQAIVAAHLDGVSIRTIAAAANTSPMTVQRTIVAAKNERSTTC